MLEKEFRLGVTKGDEVTLWLVVVSGAVVDVPGESEPDEAMSRGLVVVAEEKL